MKILLYQELLHLIHQLYSYGLVDILHNYLTVQSLYITSQQYLMKVIVADKSNVFKL